MAKWLCAKSSPYPSAYRLPPLHPTDRFLSFSFIYLRDQQISLKKWGTNQGPPRQATGPPRSGAGVGVGMLTGYHNVSWKSQRFRILIFPKYQDTIIHHQYFKKYRGLFKNILDLAGFTYVLGLSTIIQELLRFHRIFRFYLKRSDIPIVFGSTRIWT